MKKTVSSILAVLFVFSVFACLATTASAASFDAGSTFSVSNSGVKDGKITFTVNVAKGVTLENVLISAKFDNKLLKLISADAAYEKDEDGNVVPVVPGVFVGGPDKDDPTLANVGFVCESYKSPAKKRFIEFKFDVIAQNGEDASVEIFCNEFNKYDRYNSDMPVSFYKAKVSTMASPVLSVANAATGVKLTWGKVTGAAKYRIYRKANKSDSWAKLTDDTTSTSYTDTSVKNNTTYYYTVRPYNSAGKSGPYDTTGKSVKYIEAPVISSVGNSSTGITIKWGKVSGADKYRVYRKVSGGSWTKVADTTSTSCTDKTAKAGTTYYYTVKTYIGSNVSATRSGVEKKYLAQPALPTVKNTSSGVKVSWSKAAGADKYTVYRKESGGSLKKLTDTTSTSYTDKTVKSGTTYYYTIKSANSTGTSTYDKTGKSVKYLAAPKVSKISATTSGIKLTWAKVTGAKSYYVYRKAGSETSWTKIATIKDGATVTYTDKNVKNNTKYTYMLKAVNGSTTSSYVSAGWSYLFISAPKLSSATSAKAGITVKWSKVSGAKGYYVYRKTGSGSYAKVGTVKSGSTVSYTDASAKKGTTYTYTVKAYNGSYTSSYRTGLSCKDKY